MGLMSLPRKRTRAVPLLGQATVDFTSMMCSYLHHIAGLPSALTAFSICCNLKMIPREALQMSGDCLRAVCVK
uniref:Uncharacterized protein n=1 Tax=Oryza meridionalis TaxID=40149 RepID=A0A0E0ENT9_9ORYZ